MPSALKKPAKSARKPTPEKHLTECVIRTLEELSERRARRPDEAFSLTPVNPIRIVVAYSAGRDSTSLVEILNRLRVSEYKGLIEAIYVMHVHHGLSKHADSWVLHAKTMCQRWGLPLKVERVYVQPNASCGPEAAARTARYKALSRYAAEVNADVIMTAHHQDDRIETFLIQWIRGAGPEGLSAMTPVRTIECDPAGAPFVLARPWLDVSGNEIAAFATRARLSWVEDESNSDSRYLRNLIRNEILPHLDLARPGWRSAAARSVGLVGRTAEVAASIGEDDARRCAGDKPDSLNIAKLLELTTERQALCLRSWLAQNHVKAPSHAKLLEILRQLRETHGDTRLSFRLSSRELRRWGVNLVLCRPVVTPRTNGREIALTWNGEKEIALGPWGGVLRFEPCTADEAGIDASRLRAGPLEVRPRKGGEKIKLYRLRPSKTLKHLYQMFDIAAFERSELPLVWLGDTLIFAAGLGTDVRQTADPGLVTERVRLVWVPDKPLLSV